MAEKKGWLPNKPKPGGLREKLYELSVAHLKKLEKKRKTKEQKKSTAASRRLMKKL